MAVNRQQTEGDVAPAKPSRARVRVRIGGVYVTGDRSSAAEVKRAVAISTAKLEKLADKVAKPGVRIRAKRDVPLFSVDPDRPDRFVRKLNGRIDTGVLENGVFKVLD